MKQPKNASFPNRWKALAVLCAAQFMVIMDTSIIGVALPAIKDALHYGDANLHWIFNAYVIVFGGLLLLGGKFSDVFGAKRVFLSGFAILTAASLFTGLAWDENSMNVGRAIQGLGAALIAPSALTLLMTIFTDPKEIGKALGFWGASAAAGGSAGVFLGGLLTDFMGWEWTFFINIPLGILVLLSGSVLLPKGKTQKSSLDLVSSVLITAAISVLVYALVQMESAGLASVQTLKWFAAFLVLMIAFIWKQGASKDKMIPSDMWKAPNLLSSNIIMALLAGAWIPLWFYFNLFLQQIMHFSAFHSGLALLPMTLTIMVLMVMYSEKIIGAFGLKKPLVLGMFILTASLIWFALLPTDASYAGQVIWPSLLAAAGMSLAYVPATMLAMSGAKPEQTGIASGLVNSNYQVGSAIGLAIAVAVAGYVMNTAPESADIAATQSASFSAAFYLAAGLSALGTLLSIVKIKLK